MHHRPYSLIGAGYAVFLISSAALENARGRAGRLRVLRTHGPRRLATSRHVELSSRCRASEDNRKSAVPWRPARGVCRSAPQRPRWTYRFRRPALPQASLSTASGPDRRRLNVTIRLRRHHGATWRAGGAPGRLRLQPPGHRAASPARCHSPATAPRPASEDAVQTPLVIWGGMRLGLYCYRNIVKSGISAVTLRSERGTREPRRATAPTSAVHPSRPACGGHLRMTAQGLNLNAARLILFQRQALHHRVAAEFRAQSVDRVLGFGGARIDQVGKLVAFGILEVADADADQAETGLADLMREQVAAFGKDAGGKLRRRGQASGRGCGA